MGILGGLLSKDDGSPNKMIDAVGGFGLNALFLKFSRTDEQQADVVGAQMLARAGYDPQDMVDFFELLRGKQSADPGKVEQFFSSHPPPADRAARITQEMAMLTIRPTQPVGGLKAAKVTLKAMPAASSMQQIAQNRPASPPPRAYTESASRAGDVGIEVPASTFRTYEQRGRLFRIEYPSNWSVHQSTGGLGVTLAPEGGVVDAGGVEKALIYGVVVNHYEPFLNDENDAGGAKGVDRTSLAAATNDLVDQIVRTNRTLKRVPGSQRTNTIDGSAARSLVLSGRSLVTAREERVTVFTLELPDDHIVYALFIAPGQEYGRLEGTFDRMISSLRVNDESTHGSTAKPTINPGSNDVIVPSGTVLAIEFQQTLSSAKSRSGERFTARVIQPVLVDGQVAIATGSIVSGRVVNVSPSKKLGRRSRLRLEFTSLRSASGVESPISASFHGEGKSQTKRNAAHTRGNGRGNQASNRGQEMTFQKGTRVEIRFDTPFRS